MDPQSGFGMARVFVDVPKISLEMARVGREGSAYPLQCAILAVQLCPNTLARREARPLAELSWPNRRVVASHQTVPSRPTTRMIAGQCSSSVAASNMAGMTAH